MPDQLLLFCFLFFLYAHSCNSISVYFECFFAFCHSAIYTPIVLTLFPQHSLQLTSHTVSLKSEEAYAVEAWYMPECLYWHWENDDQNVFMGWYSMVYYLSNTVCVFYFPRSWWEWLAGVFIKSLNLCSVYEISITLTNLTGFFFPLCCWSVFSPEVYLVLSPLYGDMWRSKLSPGTQPELCFWKILGLKYNWGHFPFDLTKWIAVKVPSKTKGLTEHFNPGQCWSHGGGVTC